MFGLWAAGNGKRPIFLPLSLPKPYSHDMAFMKMCLLLFYSILDFDESETSMGKEVPTSILDRFFDRG
jgi:hypothetical protein